MDALRPESESGITSLKLVVTMTTSPYTYLCCGLGECPIASQESREQSPWHC